MKTYVFRLTKGKDLKQEIYDYIIKHHIQSGVILSAVGCLYEGNIRLAGGKDYLKVQKDYEIVSLMGTLCQDGVHLHISLSDENGNVIGGHLEKGCLVNTTVEIVILELELKFKREFDESTRYREIIMSK